MGTIKTIEIVFKSVTALIAAGTAAIKFIGYINKIKSKKAA